MASHYRSQLHSSNAHPDRHPDRPHVVRHDARGRGELKDGKAAYRAGDYQKALRLLKSLAKQGNASAQKYLGEMYYKGKGVPNDNAKAVHWFTKATKSPPAGMPPLLKGGAQTDPPQKTGTGFTSFGQLCMAIL